MDDVFPLKVIPDTVKAIAERLRGAGHEAWYVGGAIRDALLREQTGAALAQGDFDIATSARPEEVQGLFRRTVPVGIEHGTVAVLDPSGRTHEVTTFRRDVKTDGRHAVVAFGVALEDDLARRDFTINAMAVHPESGALRDPFAGRADLAARLVRAVGDPATRFREDQLRVLRALRFAARLHFDIEPATWDAVRQAAASLGHLSRERVRDEWRKSLGGRAGTGVGFWRRAGVLTEVWPELRAWPERAEVLLDELDQDDPVILTALVMHFAGAERAAVDAALRRLRFSNEDREFALEVLAAIRDPLPDPGDTRGLRRFLSRHRRAAAIAPAILSDGDLRERYDFVMQGILRSGVPLELAALAVTGDDLLEAGIPEGRELGATLRRLLDAVLDDPTLNSREALLARARRPA